MAEAAGLGNGHCVSALISCLIGNNVAAITRLLAQAASASSALGTHHRRHDWSGHPVRLQATDHRFDGCHLFLFPQWQLVNTDV